LPRDFFWLNELKLRLVLIRSSQFAGSMLI